jgi:hypothetical protein
MLANVKNSLFATHHSVDAKHLPRYLDVFAGDSTATSS